jgi:hypothetical protein
MGGEETAERWRKSDAEHKKSFAHTLRQRVKTFDLKYRNIPEEAFRCREHFQPCEGENCENATFVKRFDTTRRKGREKVI